MLGTTVSKDQWMTLNENLKNQFFPKVPVVRVYQSPGLALHDIARGTVHFMTHKKSVAMITGSSPYLEAILGQLYKDRIEMAQSYFSSDSDLSVIDEWLKSSVSQLSFALWAEDHILSSRFNSWSEGLVQSLEKNRVISIQISHHRYLSQSSDQLEVKPYQVKLLVLADETVIALCGSRFRTPTVFGDYQMLDEPIIKKQIDQTWSHFQPKKEEVIQFESDFKNTFLIKAQLPGNWVHSESPSNQTCIAVQGLAGDLWVKSYLLQFPGDKDLIASTHQCLVSPKNWSWLSREWTPQVLSECVIVKAALIKDSKKVKVLFDIAKELQTQLVWTW